MNRPQYSCCAADQESASNRMTPSGLVPLLLLLSLQCADAEVSSCFVCEGPGDASACAVGDSDSLKSKSCNVSDHDSEICFFTRDKGKWTDPRERTRKMSTKETKMDLLLTPSIALMTAIVTSTTQEHRMKTEDMSKNATHARMTEMTRTVKSETTQSLKPSNAEKMILTMSTAAPRERRGTGREDVASHKNVRMTTVQTMTAPPSTKLAATKTSATPWTQEPRTTLTHLQHPLSPVQPLFSCWLLSSTS